MSALCKILAFMLVIILGSVGCSALPMQSTPAPTTTPLPPITTLECDPILLHYTLDCTRTVGGVMLQSEDLTQQTFELGTISTVFNGTIYVTHLLDTLTIGTLEGNAAVSANIATRVIQSGMETTITLQTDSFQAMTSPTEALPFSQQTLQSLPLFRLSRRVSPNLIVTAPPPAILNQQTASDCLVPEGWSGFYEVQRGDSFSSIAAQFNTTVAELQEANCLPNSDRLFPDDILRVPGDIEETEASFEAENTILSTGECTTLSWSAEGASVIYYQGEAVANSGSMEVCPETTTTYTLLIVYTSGEQVGYTQTINVNE